MQCNEQANPNWDDAVHICAFLFVTVLFSFNLFCAAVFLINWTKRVYFVELGVQRAFPNSVHGFVFLAKLTVFFYVFFLLERRKEISVLSPKIDDDDD